MKKSTQFHESLDREEAQDMPSERSFAHVMGGAFYVLAALAWYRGGHFDARDFRLIAVGSIFLAVGYTRPILLRPLNKLWMQFGHLLFKFTNPVIMLTIYALTILPMGLLMRAMGKDPLQRNFDKNAKTYWVTREIPGPPPETMKRQF
jgi:hypothetical protein